MVPADFWSEYRTDATKLGGNPTDVDVGFVTLENSGVIPHGSQIFGGALNAQCLLQWVGGVLVAERSAAGPPESAGESGHCGKMNKQLN